jgi:hypothetical protein
MFPAYVVTPNIHSHHPPPRSGQACDRISASTNFLSTQADTLHLVSFRAFCGFRELCFSLGEYVTSVIYNFFFIGEDFLRLKRLIDEAWNSLIFPRNQLLS